MKFYAELYPLFAGRSRYVRPDGTTSAFRVTYESKVAMQRAVRKFRKGEESGLLMSYQLFEDKCR